MYLFNKSFVLQMYYYIVTIHIIYYILMKEITYCVNNTYINLYYTYKHTKMYVYNFFKENHL